MRRWNGWGDQTIEYTLSANATAYLTKLLGSLKTYPDAAYSQVLDSVPDSRLSHHPLINRSPQERLAHARGQSLPDWIELRSGLIPAYPDGVAYPSSDDEISELMVYARQTGAYLIPYGGGTSVVGHIDAPETERPVLTLDMSRVNQLLALDETSNLATFGAGASGPDIETSLSQQGYTLGHYPQSFEFSTLGGWIATRSSGQQSFHYGRIEELFAGGLLITPVGPIEINPTPASAAGPDLRQLILGSEGRLGVLTRAIVRVRPQPTRESFAGVIFPSWETGVQAVREVVQSGIQVSMLRLSDPAETGASLILSGRESLRPWMEGVLGMLGYGSNRCLLVLGVTGDPFSTSKIWRRARAVIRAHKGLPVGRGIGENWRANRFRTPYLRNSLWDLGVAVDTLETAVRWDRVTPLATAVRRAIETTMHAFDEKVLVLTHLSHVYRDGASVYITILFRRTGDPSVLMARWRKMKAAASRTILGNHGTISHQHGVGIDHAPYLREEKGEVGWTLLNTMLYAVDPDGILNPGKLLQAEDP